MLRIAEKAHSRKEVNIGGKPEFKEVTWQGTLLFIQRTILYLVMHLDGKGRQEKYYGFDGNLTV